MMSLRIFLIIFVTGYSLSSENIEPQVKTYVLILH